MQNKDVKILATYAAILLGRSANVSYKPATDSCHEPRCPDVDRSRACLILNSAAQSIRQQSQFYRKNRNAIIQKEGTLRLAACLSILQCRLQNMLYKAGPISRVLSVLTFKSLATVIMYQCPVSCDIYTSRINL